MKIPFSRLVIYILLAGLLPLSVVGIYYLREKRAWSDVCQHIDATLAQSVQKSARQAINAAVRNKYKNGDPHFVEKLEALNFLSKERSALEEFISKQSYTGGELFESRYRLLTSGENRLLFAEKEIQNGEGIRETLEVLTKPVEIDHDDLKNVLGLIEFESAGKPQLIITDFLLTKKKISGNEVFELNCSFLKREFEHEI